MKTLSYQPTFLMKVSSEIKPLVKDFTAFLRKPDQLEESNLSHTEKVRNILLLWAVNLALALTASFGVEALQTAGIIPDTNVTDDFKKLFRNAFYALGVGAVLIPILEETVFRSWLRNPRIVLGFIGAGFVYLIILGVNQLTMFQIIVWKAYVIYDVLWILAEVFFRNQSYRSALSPAYARVFPVVFYASVLVFGLVHASNYELSQIPYWVYPLLTLPQLIAGCFLGYARIRYGFWYGVLLHAIHNAVVFSVVLLCE